MKKWGWGILAGIVFVFVLFLAFGTMGQEEVRTDGYKYLIGVSVTNVVEPWLDNLIQDLTEKVEEDERVNLIVRDAADSPEKQQQDIELLMECEIDLLVLAPDGSDLLNPLIEEIYQQIPVVVVGVELPCSAYTTLIQVDDEKIGQMAGEFILENLYEEGDNIVVIQGVESSPISEKRLNGFLKTVNGIVPEKDITYYYGDWLRDRAELRMMEYLVGGNHAKILFAFNDEMAYGAYLAYQELRVKDEVYYIGVDGFENEDAGLRMIEQGILEATIQTPDFDDLVYNTSLSILLGNEVERNITIAPQMIVKD